MYFALQDIYVALFKKLPSFRIYHDYWVIHMRFSLRFSASINLPKCRVWHMLKAGFFVKEQSQLFIILWWLRDETLNLCL